MIRDSKTRDEAREKIKAYDFGPEEAEALGILLRGQPSLLIVEGRYVLTDIQVSHILELRLYQLVGLERDKIKADYDELLETIKDLLDIIAREERVLQIIKDELREIQEKWATPRKTDFAAYEGEIANVDLIANESNMITISHRGYIKRTLATEFRTQARGGKGMKGMETRDIVDEDDEVDFVEHLFAATSHDYLMFFTNTGRVYIERVYQIPEGSRIAKGRSIKNLLNLKPDESIASVLRIVAVGNEDKDATFVDDQFVLFATRSGKVKKTKLSDFRNFRKDGIIAIKIEEGNELIMKGMETRDIVDEDDEVDFVEHLFAATSHDYLMFFTNTGRVYIERVYQIPEGSRIAKGRSIKNLLNLKPDESIASVLRIVAVGNEDKDATFVDDQFVLFATRSGKVKKTKLSDFRNFRKDGIIAIKIEEGNELIDVKMTDGSDDISLVTSKGYAVRTNESNIRSMGRASAGVRGINPRDDDYLVSLAVVDSSEQLLVVSEKGLGKRTPFEDYPTKGRGGKGVITMKVTEKTGRVVKALRVSEADDIMLMTNKGQSVRIKASSARLTGRNAQGVILMKTKEGEAIQDIARVVNDDIEDEEVTDVEGVEVAEGTEAPESTTSAEDVATEENGEESSSES